MFKKSVVMALSLLSATSVLANTTEADFPGLKNYAKSLSQQPLNAMQGLHPESVFLHYSEHPTEEGYYSGVESEKTDLAGAASSALKEDVAGKTVVENFGQHQFEINPNSPEVKRAKEIEEQSEAITHGTASCQDKPPVCEMKEHEETCHASRQLPEQTCIKKLNVTVDKEQINQVVQLEIVVPKKFEGFISVNLITGAMTNAAGGHVSTVPTLKNGCAGLSARVTSIRNNQKPADWVLLAALPSCANPGVFTIYLSKKFKRSYPIQITLVYEAHSNPYASDEHWENTCQSLEGANGLCQMVSSQCTDAINPRVINGLNVARDCWESVVTYACRSAFADECRSQKEKGCLQLSSRCTSKDNNTCALYEQVYRCSEKTCEASMPCVQPIFCSDGSCTPHEATQNTNFGESAARVAATGESGKEFSKTQAGLFTGHVERCKIWAINLIDCCSDKGWGKAIDLVHCRDEDRALGQAKLNYLVHYLGEYCSDEVLGVCLEHKRTYCVFDTKMARIIQEEGRLRQLNSGALGTAESPTCGGLTVQELQRIDFARVDFLNPVYPFHNGVPTPDAGIVPSQSNTGPTVDELLRRVQKKVGGQ